VSLLPEAVQVGEWRVEQELDLIARDGRAIKVEPRAMRVLTCLIARAGHVVSVEELLEQAWPDVVVGPDSVYQAVGLLRRLLGDDRFHPAYIEHVPRKGYRLVASVGTPVGPRPLLVNGTPPHVATASVTAINGASGNGATAPAAMTADAGATAAAATSQRRYGKRIVWAALTVSIATLAATYLLVSSHARTPPAGSLPAATAGIRAPLVAASAPPSIAVLPFLDLSEKQDLGYFADGLSEELIDLLARGSDLRVPARTSSFYFKGKTVTVAEMAHALSVDNLLEGSVRRSGNRVRVTAQLIRADNGYHLWSQTYDRELKEAFTVEDEIALAVTQRLQVKLNGEHVPPGTRGNAEARSMFLQCHFFTRRNTPADADKAVACFHDLLALAPEDAPAWAGYADALLRLPVTKDLPIADLRSGAAAARQAAGHALSLDPGLAAAHALVSSVDRLVDRDWAAAGAELKAALASDPDDPATLLSAANLARDLGQLDRAIEFCERARERDPLNFQPYARLGVIYLYQGKLSEAEAAVRRRIDLAPEGFGGYSQLADVLLARGQPQAALEAARQEPDEESRLVALARAYHALGRQGSADQSLAELRHRWGGRYPTEMAEVYAYRGDTARALAALELAFTAGDPAVNSIRVNSYFKPLESDRRYQVLLLRLNLAQSSALF
jgi:TolB-like protein/DNA-binding winged helix-turn-helix (wHTH) protein/predicted Zn-dependent protease